MTTNHTKHLFPYPTRDADRQLVSCVSAFFVGGGARWVLRGDKRIELGFWKWMGDEGRIYAGGDIFYKKIGRKITNVKLARGCQKRLKDQTNTLMLARVSNQPVTLKF